MFKYKVIDNFLYEEDFNILCSIRNQLDTKHNLIRSNNIIYKNGHIELGWLEAKFIKKLHNNYHDRVIELLKELAPEKVKLYDNSTFQLVQTGSHCMYKIHPDKLEKLLSIVIYLKPKVNKGTILYESLDGDNPIEIKWKQNRAIIFSRSDNSFHSWEGDKKNNRFTLNYFLRQRLQ
jgi:hypothetical protein